MNHEGGYPCYKLFQPVWTQDEDGGFTVSVDEIDSIGYGNTQGEAAEVLVTAALEYAESFLPNWIFIVLLW